MNLVLDYLLFFHPLLVPGTVILGAVLGGPFYFLTPFLILVSHPLCDFGMGQNPLAVRRNSSPHFIYMLAALLFVPLELTVFFWAIRHFALSQLSGIEALGLILSTGFITGTFGFTLAHEFIHRKGTLSKWVGMLLLYLTSYPHYRLFHINWHHRHVATPLDPGTAKKGESLYRFWSRAIPNNLSISLALETKRMQTLKRNRYSVSNSMVQFFSVQMLIYAAVFSFWGIKGVSFFLGQSVVAILLLETIHYLEHYGLLRKRLSNGHFEPIEDKHSWDCHYRYTNWYLFNLGYHSHHHLDPSRPYEQLHWRKTAPVMPYGLSTMLMMAFVPKLWFRIMDPKLNPTQPNPNAPLTIGGHCLE